jgi:serine/threonine protein kinase
MSDAASWASVTLLGCIGEGGFGAVYRADANGRSIAAKILTVDGDTAELMHEVRVLRACEHVNVVRVYHAFERAHPRGGSAPALWILMELCSAGSVEDVLMRRGAALDEGTIAYVCAGMVRGLEYLHGRGVIHRDVKAGNVLLTAGAEVKLSDLGVATILAHAHSRRHSVVGTPTHMAPEALMPQASGQSGYDSRVDVWSLGVTALFLAEHDGRSDPACWVADAWAGAHDALELANRIVAEPPPTLRPSTPASPTFRHFVASALVKDAASRPAATYLAAHPFVASATSAEPLLRCLEGVGQGPPPVAPSKPAKRHFNLFKFAANRS